MNSPAVLALSVFVSACGAEAGQTTLDDASTGEAVDAPLFVDHRGVVDEQEAGSPEGTVPDAIDDRYDAGRIEASEGGSDAAIADADRSVQSLTPDERGRLCDWMNAELGGYGQSFVCGGGIVKNAPDQAACVAAIFTDGCRMTVHEFEACVSALAPDHGCNPQYDRCAPLYACYVFD